MSYPHDYYTYDPDHPELHNRCEGRPYLEPDWHATHHDAQLPALSAIGRGPRGEGIYVGSTTNQDGTVTFSLYSTLTGEAVYTSPNLAPWDIEFIETTWNSIAAGIPAALDIVQTRGEETHTTHAYLPPGEPGSRVFLYEEAVEYRDDRTYSCTVGDLVAYGRPEYQNKPIPRPNDVIMFSCVGPTVDDCDSLGVGIIEAVGTNTRETHDVLNDPHGEQVVFTANVYVRNNAMMRAITNAEIDEVCTRQPQ